MGKSDKKIKADRINALRKQYDEFLGEDKRRKERNEFILGRLDKMRSCTSVTQIRSMPNAYVDARSVTLYNRSMHILEKPSGHGVQCHRTESQQPPADNLVKNPDEAFLLHEISKKFILIPKNDTFINIYPRDSYDATPILKGNIDNDDWKSKYEILAQLKQNEKETIEMTSHREKYIGNIKEHPISDLNIKHSIEAEKQDAKLLSDSKNKIEIPEKDLPDNKIYNITNPEGMPISRGEKREILIPPPEDLNIVKFTLPEENFYSYSYSDDSKPQINEPLNESTADTAIKKIELQPELDHSLPNEELANHEQAYNEKISYEVEYEKQYQPAEEKYFENVVDPQENDMTPIELINSGDLVGHINDKLGAQSHMSEDPQYPTEIINPQEFTPNDNVNVWDGVNVNQEEYPAHQYEQQSAVYAEHVEKPENVPDNNDVSADGINVNPEGFSINESNFDPAYNYDPQSASYAHVENDPAMTEYSDNNISSGNEVFNSEQRDLFYQEQIDEKAAYDQQGLVEAAYVQNENYEYSCYEGQEGTPAEVNEQVETSERYDPHYEQQYMPLTYEQEYSTHDNQQPSDGAHLDEEHEYNEDKLNHETSENIKQQLDNEQGFVDTPSEQMEVENIIEQEIQPATLQASEPNA